MSSERKRTAHQYKYFALCKPKIRHSTVKQLHEGGTRIKCRKFSPILTMALSQKLLVTDGLQTDDVLKSDAKQKARKKYDTAIAMYDTAIAMMKSAKTDMLQLTLRQATDPLVEVTMPRPEHNGSWKSSVQQSARMEGTRNQGYRAHVVQPQLKKLKLETDRKLGSVKLRRKKLEGSTGVVFRRLIDEQTLVNVEEFDDPEFDGVEVEIVQDDDVATLTKRYEEEIKALDQANNFHHNDVELGGTDDLSDSLQELEARYREMVEARDQ